MRDMKSFWRWMFLSGVVSMFLHGANIGYVLHCSQRDDVEYYDGPDTPYYVQNSAAMFDERPLSPLFRERIVYPLMLAAVHHAGIEYRQLLWLTAPFEIPAVLAMAWMGWILTRRKSVAALGAWIYMLNPNGYQLGATLMPDWFNGQIIVMAVALLLNWAANGHRKSGLAACVLLPLSQMIRPTLFPVLVPMILLLGKGFFVRNRRAINGLLCACVMAYPAVTAAINYKLYGVPRMLLAPGLQLHQGYVSYIRAMKRNAEHPDSITRLYFDEKHNVALADPRERAVNPYGNGPIRPDFAENYNDIVRTSTAYLQENFSLWIQSGSFGIYHQLFYPPHFEPDPRASRLYPDLASAMPTLHKVALFFAFCGVMLSIRRLPMGVTLFYACCTAIIAMAVTAGWNDSVRVRLLLDLIYTPILAVALLSVPAWACLGCLATFAYGPRKLLHFSNTYMIRMSEIILLGSAMVLLRISGREDAPVDK
jgi:hypothetical protein